MTTVVPISGWSSTEATVPAVAASTVVPGLAEMSTPSWVRQSARVGL